MQSNLFFSLHLFSKLLCLSALCFKWFREASGGIRSHFVGLANMVKGWCNYNGVLCFSDRCKAFCNLMVL